MKSNSYGSMLNGLSKVNLSGSQRARAELHLRRAAAFVDMVMGPRKELAAAASARVEAPAVEEFRKAA
jgi:hypothetical protein